MIINKAPLTVSQLNQRIRLWLEHDIGPVTVEGELSNVSKPASGHYYFTLKDSGAQLRCVYFKNRVLARPDLIPEHGQQIIAQGTLSLYEARGDYQLIVQSLEPAGQGDLFHQFEQLKKKLSQEGLFESHRKKSLPPIPHAIGIITSSTAAALKDILTTLARRFPLTPVVIYPSDVQGKGAPAQLIAALERANQDQRCDVLLLGRGGGSLEDLWAFNDERLARAIAASRLPIVTGIGHETDFTIADFVADHRAATPTAAAETVTPDQIQLKNDCMNMILDMHQSLQHILSQKRQTLQRLQQTLESQHPAQRLILAKTQLKALTDQLMYRMKTKKTQSDERFKTVCATLHAISPLATLDRGYAIALYQEHVLTNANTVSPGDTIHLKLAQGNLSCNVLTREPYDR